MKWIGTITALDIDPAAIEMLAEALAEKVAVRLSCQGSEDCWMTSAEAAEYLAVPISTLRKLTAAGSVPFSQDVVGGRCYFKRDELDHWRARSASGSSPGSVGTPADRMGSNKRRSKSGPATLQRPGPWPKEVELHEQESG